MADMESLRQEIMNLQSELFGTWHCQHNGEHPDGFESLNSAPAVLDQSLDLDTQHFKFKSTENEWTGRPRNFNNEGKDEKKSIMSPMKENHALKDQI
jgi:hypothetical protein